MKDTSTILYTFEDSSGAAETFDLKDFKKIITGEKQVGSVMVELEGENESIQVPLLDGYREPYDWAVTDEIGTEHFIYYEEKNFYEKHKLSDYAKERTIDWLNGMQSNGFFEGYPENDMDFTELADEDLAYYFIEWYFTEPDEEFEDDDELVAERKRILS